MLKFDAVVIGGGFYGANIAAYLILNRGLQRVALIEREPALMNRSSFVNQARVHGGYHYLRSFTTAYRSRINLPRFQADFGSCIFDRFENIYALAGRNSRVTAHQMERFCAEIGAPLSPAPKHTMDLFNQSLIDRAYSTYEFTFNADELRQIMMERLGSAGVSVFTQTDFEQATIQSDNLILKARRGNEYLTFASKLVFNCTYSRLQKIAKVLDPGVSDFRLRHEITELVLIKPPKAIANMGITVMDGPFFSIMPFPARAAHSLTHVRYTPHLSWLDHAVDDPYKKLSDYEKHSGIDWMIRDVCRYLPCVADCTPTGALFEVKTVLTKSEGDDSRPILFERHGTQGRIFSVLGGKIDNIYDILERLDSENIQQGIN